ncbi:MAG TPA: crosslink repair DNA glycosylase YcaQ family protein [Candidatus Limnocylindria bacterium]|nr:crosslink repair DNA glycosylase YcaQ family protein [Candidatus Limnocylindria bacterium]
MAVLELTRERILAFRRATQALDRRLPFAPDSLRRAAWAGLQDSVPRSALHSLHARVEAVPPDVLDDPALVQVWGLRYTAFVVPADAHWAFTLSRLPEKGRTRQRAEELAARLQEHLDGRRVPYGRAGEALGVHPNALRYASLTGTVLIRWEGARAPLIWKVPAPEMTALEARVELARRYHHLYGPSTPDAFARWAGLSRKEVQPAWALLQPSLLSVQTPIGEAELLTEDEPLVRAAPAATGAVRLLPSGDPYYLLQGADRELLVPDGERRPLLWTPRVWPGALLIGDEIAGTWRRAEATVVVSPWRRLSPKERTSVEAEAATLPLPEVSAAVQVRWDDAAG